MSIERREGREGGAIPWTLAGFTLAHLVIFAVVFQTIYVVGFSGIGLYFGDMTRMFAHQVPYRDFVLEYPPFAIAFFAIPRLFGATYAVYYRGFQVELIVCDLAILLVLDAIARARDERPAVILGAYTVFTLAVGPIVAQQFDLFAAALTLFAVYFGSRGRRGALWVLLALGALTKLYPLLLAPVFMIGNLRRREWKTIGRAAGAAAATVVIVMLPLLIAAPTAIRSFFAYHANRGIQLESTYAGLLLAADKLHLGYVGISTAYGAWNVTGQYAAAAAVLSIVVLVALLVAAYAFLYRTWGRLPQCAEHPALMDTVYGSSVVVVVFATLVGSKVLSPQYIIWALPLVPLVRGRFRRVIWGLYVLVGATTHYIFPAHYDQLIRDDGGIITVLIIRNLLLLALGLLGAAAVRESIQAAARGVAAESTVRLTTAS